MTDQDKKKTFNYEVEEPFLYAHNGEQIEASFIEFTAPTAKLIRYTSSMKESFFQAMPDGDTGGLDGEKDEADALQAFESIDGATVMSLISAGKVELGSVLLTAMELFKSKGIALVDGEEKLTQPIIDRMCPDEFEAMVGEYFINFILASWLKQMKKRLSK